MDPSEYYDFEDRRYINPTLSRDEQLGFVDTLRETVGNNTARINAQTQALGTDIPSNLGGLTGSNGYFAQRYQTTPVETQAKNLKAAAQAKALNDLMTNYQNQAQNRYNQAYRSYNKRKGGGGGSGMPDTTTPEGDIEFEDNQTQIEDKKPPKAEDYYISGEEQTKRIVERTGLPDWLVNVLKIFGAA